MKLCDTPYCQNRVDLEKTDAHSFCKECKELHSLCVLKIQVDHEKSIKSVIMDARIFKSAQGMADYIGVSCVTLYNWIEKYFDDKSGKGLSFQEFRREHICRSTKCYILDIKRSSYSRPDYILKKLRSLGRCACVNALASDLIMTNAPLEDVQKVLRGHPRIKQVSEGVFALAPNAIHFRKVQPVKIWKQSAIHLKRKVFPIKFKQL